MLLAGRGRVVCRSRGCRVAPGVRGVRAPPGPGGGRATEAEKMRMRGIPIPRVREIH